MFWTVLLILGISQVLSLVNTLRNYRYALAKYKKTDSVCRPNTALIVPCKGIDCNFRENIRSFYNLDYDNYVLWFVVGEEDDPAYAELIELREQLGSATAARDVRICVAGLSETCGQKIHNLLYCVDRISPELGVLAFADSDISVRPNWLKRLVWPLRKQKAGITSGYRWFIPVQNNGASLALSAINAKVTQLLGNTRFSQAWGGSMAIRADLFAELGIKQIWEKALSDDFSLTYAVRKAGYRIVFVPACLVASHHSTDWPGLVEFGRRQFLITRVYAFYTWLFGLLGVLLSVLGFWLPPILAVCSWYSRHGFPLQNRVYPSWPLWTGLFAVVLLMQLAQAFLRQNMASKLMSDSVSDLKIAARADMLGFWLWSLLLLFLVLSSAVGRTICWRGIRYRLLGPTQTVVLGRRGD
jgi:ceramide glucosyltransferase